MTLVREIHAPDVLLREWLHGRSERLVIEERSASTVVLIKSGRATVALGREIHPLRRLAVVTVGPGTTATLEMNDARVALVECLLEPGHLVPGDVLLPRHGLTGAFGVFRSAKPAWKDLLELMVAPSDPETAPSAAVIQGGVFTALERVRRRERRKGRPEAAWLEVARARLTAEFRTPPLVLELAREAGIERRRFVRLFRQRYGLTPSDYLREVRVRQATRLMRTTTLSPRAIALECGFHHRQHLERSLRLAFAGGELDPMVLARLRVRRGGEAPDTHSSPVATHSHPQPAGRHVPVSARAVRGSF